MTQYCAGLYKTYDEYIQSEEWKEIKRFWIERRSVCQNCGELNINKLVVHHLNYNNCGNEQDEDVMALCYGCHHDIHYDKKKYDKKRGI